MSGTERADLGFGDALADFDPGEWQPKAPKPRTERPKPEEAAKIAEVSGFKSREPKMVEVPKNPAAGQGAKPAPRRRRTGRNAQFNLKAKPETIDAYCALADRQGWGLGETLERAVELLQREYGS